jgi:hypothetical protein
VLIQFSATSTKPCQCSPAQFHSPRSGASPQRFCDSSLGGTAAPAIRDLKKSYLHSRRKKRISNAPVAIVLLLPVATGFDSQA